MNYLTSKKYPNNTTLSCIKVVINLLNKNNVHIEIYLFYVYYYSLTLVLNVGFKHLMGRECLFWVWTQTFCGSICFVKFQCFTEIQQVETEVWVLLSFGLFSWFGMILCKHDASFSLDIPSCSVCADTLLLDCFMF